MARYNPEKRAWRGKSYKKPGKRVADLRVKAREKVSREEVPAKEPKIPV